VARYVHEISLWRIYFAKNCHCTRPEPLSHYVVPVGTHGNELLTFIITSALAPFVRSQPQLQAAHAPILASDHPCLHHDSYINCGELCWLSPWEIRPVTQNHLTDEMRNQMVTIVKATPLIEPVYKRIIVQAADEA
jgi:hypothetical protein